MFYSPKSQSRHHPLTPIFEKSKIMHSSESIMIANINSILGVLRPPTLVFCLVLLCAMGKIK